MHTSLCMSQAETRGSRDSYWGDPQCICVDVGLCGGVQSKLEGQESRVSYWTD